MIINDIRLLIKKDDLASANNLLNRYTTIIKDESNDDNLWRKKTFLLPCDTKYVSIMVRGEVIAVYEAL
ncbi:MAG: hypothetical protein ACRC3J_09285 [Culicoidibacterales bacterium]